MTRPYKQWKQQYDEQQHELKKHATALDNIVFKIDKKNKNEIPSLPLQPRLPLQLKKAKTIQNLPQHAEPQISRILSSDILKSIVYKDYKDQLKYKLRDWISTILDEQLRIEKIEPDEWPKWLCANTNVTAIGILEGKYREENGPASLDWKELCKNPIAISLIEKAYIESPKMIEYDELAGNSAAYDFLIREKEINPANFHWGNFSANSRIGTIFTDKYAEENEMVMEDYFMLRDWEKLDWAKVSSNRSTYVLQYLFKNVPHSLINIGSLSGNPNPIAIKFLKKRIKFEKRLQAEVLERLQYHEKIDWFLLSGNYAAFHLLLANKDKIIWAGLSLNESAIPLIKERIIIEERLMKQTNKELAKREKVIDDLKQQIENLKINVRDNENRLLRVVLEYPKISIKNQIYELEKKIVELEKEIDSVPHIENNFLFEPNKLNWPSLCSNSKAIKILENEYKKNPNNIHLQYLLANPSIFVLDRGDPSYPSNEPIRFRSSSGNNLPGVEPFSQSYKPGAKSAPAKISLAKKPVTKKPASLKSLSSSRKTSNDMVEDSMPSTPLTPRSLNASPLPVPSLSRNPSNIASPSTPKTP
jgi:hypothetical protein